MPAGRKEPGVTGCCDVQEWGRRKWGSGRRGARLGGEARGSEFGEARNSARSLKLAHSPSKSPLSVSFLKSSFSKAFLLCAAT